MPTLREDVDRNSGPLGLLGIGVGIVTPLLDLTPSVRIVLFSVAGLLGLASLWAILSRRRAMTSGDEGHIQIGSISSTNQSGGFTGIKVVVGSVPRQPSREQFEQLFQMLPPGCQKVGLMYPTGDREAINLGEKIAEFLRGRGIEVDEVGVMSFQWPTGVTLQVDGPFPVIRVGHR